MIALLENRQKMTIIEITCPYSNYSNNQRTLETAHYSKKAKYNNLIDEIRENNDPARMENPDNLDRPFS